MPKKRTKIKKTKEEKIAEEYFPVDKSDLKHTIEKQYKKPDRKSLEKIEKPAKKKRKARKKTTRKKPVTKKEYKIPKISLKKSGYELIITEKPQAALKIASALGKSTKKANKKVPYYEVDRDGKELVVACAVGHLFALKQKNSGQAVPVFDVIWLPNYMIRKKDFTKNYYDTISKLVKGASSITVATDYDVEGEVIGLNVIRFIAGQKDAERMKFSTLTKDELNQAYENKSKNIDWGQAIAGETRHYLDWFYGINLSRALMNAIKSTGKFKIMSIGRVQGPALNLIVQREKSIQAFKPETYWQIFIKIKNKHELELKHNKDIFDKSKLKVFEKLKGKEVEANTTKKEQTLIPNPAFDLTTLQTEAYKFHSITPSRTLQIAQGLYLNGLISYPRTSSQKLPASINYKEILKKVASEFNVKNLIKRKAPIEGKKSDPAHPAIYPTGEFQILAGDDKKLYELIAKRFLAAFCEDALIENKRIAVNIDKLIFSAKGISIKKKAWLEIYPHKLKENEVPDIDGKVKITEVRSEEKQTKPPNRYTPASIVSGLEKRNLGTKATRANILETLYDREYIKNRSIEATPLGMSLIETMENHSPIIIDENLTRGFEEKMDEIRNSKKDLDEKETKVVEEAKEAITKIINNFKEKERDIGIELVVANAQLREQQQIENRLNICPVCKKGNLKITYSKKTRRHFVACDKFPECKTTFTLPPNGAIKRAEKICEKCGFPLLTLFKRGKRPWTFCFNPNCETNKERLEEYRKKQEEKNKE